MKILTRYLLYELGKWFFITLLTFTLLVVVVFLLKEALAQDLPLGPVLKIIPYALPDALRVTIPLSALLAVTVVYGQFSGEREMVALKAAGVTPMAVLWPMFISAILVSMVAVWLNDLAVSWGRVGTQRVIMESVDEIAYSMLRAQKRYRTPYFSINVKRVEGRRLIGTKIWLPKAETSISAVEAEIEADNENGILWLTLRDSMITVQGKRLRQTDEERYPIPMSQASRAKKLGGHPSSIPIREIDEEVAHAESVIERSDRGLAVRAAFSLMTGDVNSLNEKKWDGYRSSRKGMNERLSRLRTEPHRRFSAGFSCLCFVLLGAPVAIRLNRSDVVTTFFVCFLPILIFYYPLFAYGIEGAKNGTLPPYAVWGGNIFISILGLLTLRKVMRY